MALAWMKAENSSRKQDDSNGPDPDYNHSRVNKANFQTLAARWNRETYRRLGVSLKNDPEADLIARLGPSYSEKLQSHKTLGGKPCKYSYQPDDIRSRIRETDPTTVLFELSPELQQLIGDDTDEDDLSNGLLDLMEESEVLYKCSWTASVTVFKISDAIVVKVCGATPASIVEHYSLVYLQSHLPDFPAPRPHGLVQVGHVHLLFMSLMPGRDLEHVWPELDGAQKQNISSQIDYLLSDLRSLARPPGTPLGSVDGSGCRDRRRHERTNSEPIWNVEQFQDFVFAGSRAPSAVYPTMLRQLMPTSAAIVFTHGDIRPANIMMDTDSDGNWRIAGIIDWEMSGFYPDYWECVKMTSNLYCLDKFDWYNYLPKSVSHQRYPMAWLVDRALDPCLFNS